LHLPERIPPLAGPLRTAYRVVGALLILLTLLAGTVGTWLIEDYIFNGAKAFYAAGIRNTAVAGGVIGVAPFSDEARAAGLPAGQLLAIDGVDVRGDARLMKVLPLLTGPEGSKLTLRITGPDGVRDYRLTRSASYLSKADSGIGYVARMRIRRAFDLAAGLLVALVIGLLWLRRPRDPVAALLVIGATLLSIGPMPSVFTWLPGWLTPLTYFLGMSAIHAGLILFPSGSLRPRWVLGALVAIVWLALAPIVFLQTWVLPVSIAVESLITLAVIVTRFRAAEPGIERQQIKWAALGLAVFALFFLVQAMLTASIDAAPNEAIRAWVILFANLAANLAILALGGGIMIALLRYRLYDAEAAISRSAVLASLTLVLLGIFTLAEKAIEAVGQSWFGASLGNLSGGAAAALAAILVAPLHHRLTRWSENRFQKDLIELREKLPVLVADLRETATTPELAEEVLQRVTTILRATVGALTINGEAAALRDVEPGGFAEWQAGWTAPRAEAPDVDKDDPLLPVRVPLDADGSGRVGWLLLGRRPDGSLYGKDEREVLAEIADPIARALAITGRREAETNATRTLAERIEARMASLEALVERSLEEAGRTRSKS